MKWSPYYEIGLYSRINFRNTVDRILFEQNQKLDAILPRRDVYFQQGGNLYMLQNYSGSSQSLFGHSLFGDLFGFDL